MKDVLKFIFVLVIILLVISGIIFEIYILVTYGGKPVSEVPTWMLWFLFTDQGG